MSNVLKEYIGMIVEAKIREVDITGGKALWGSPEHISDLEGRISDLTSWRDRYRRGTEARANYSRLVSRLRAEMASAKKYASRISEQDE